MKWFSAKTFLEVFNQALIGITSAWFGIALVSPGIFGVSSLQEYFKLLIQSFPFGMMGLIFSSVLAEKIKSL